MSFGKNPYVAKAQAAELKAGDAADSAAQARAYREAAHEWERAAGREPPGKRRTEYEQNAARNRDLADGEGPETNGARAEESDAPHSPLCESGAKKPMLN